MLGAEKQLARMADALEKNNALLRRILDRIDGGDPDEVCPDCGSDDLDNASTMGNPRMVCCKCDHAWVPEVTDG